MSFSGRDGERCHATCVEKRGLDKNFHVKFTCKAKRFTTESTEFTEKNLADLRTNCGRIVGEVKPREGQP